MEKLEDATPWDSTYGASPCLDILRKLQKNFEKIFSLRTI
jgi:hypothetical protein